MPPFEGFSKRVSLAENLHGFIVSERENIKNSLARGTPKDWTEYQKAVGRLQAYATLDAEMTEQIKAMNED